MFCFRSPSMFPQDMWFPNSLHSCTSSNLMKALFPQWSCKKKNKKWLWQRAAVQGQVGQDFEQLGLAEGVGLREGVPAHSRRLELDELKSPFQPKLFWFCDIIFFFFTFVIFLHEALPCSILKFYCLLGITLFIHWKLIKIGWLENPRLHILNSH